MAEKTETAVPSVEMTDKTESAAPSGDVAAEKPATAERLQSLLNEGRKALVLEEYADAVDKLGEAAALAVQLYDNFAPETFDPHYLYGKTLLQLASVEKELIEDKFKDLDQMKESIKEMLAETLTAEATPMETDQQEPAAEAEKTTEATKEDAEKPTEAPAQEEKVADVTIEQTTDQVDDEEEAENVENAQLAWESLEYAKTVCVKNIGDNSPEWLGRHKDVLILLGQCAVNDDNFALAIEDLKNALDIVTKHFSEDLREEAFINMELARTQRKAKDFDAAIQHLDASHAALEKFKGKLQADKSTDSKKLEEIDELLNEVNDEKTLTRTRAADDKENVEQQPPKKSDGNVVVSEALVIKRKDKRPAEEDSTVEAEPPKKSKDEEVAAE